MAGTWCLSIWLSPGRVPAFEEIEPDVKTAWLGEQKSLAWQKSYADMRAKYVVLLPVTPGEAAQAPVTGAPAKKQIPTSSGEAPL